jgi:phosphotransferase system HPr-like phosphotransfer protein
MSLITLNVDHNSNVKIKAEGSDAAEVCVALQHLIEGTSD